ncbi:hypothetical protein H9L39_17435, partial [Fusarium oxysporum f. sp. albedinis]
NKDTDMVRQLDCEHTFHSDCIAAWYLANQDTCPICAHNFVPSKNMPQWPPQVHVKTYEADVL